MAQVEIIKTKIDSLRKPLIALVCKDTQEAKRFLKSKYERNKGHIMDNNGKKLSTFDFIYEIVRPNNYKIDQDAED